MLDKGGVQQTDRQAIADVFADFYSDLYASRRDNEAVDGQWARPMGKDIPAVTEEELQRQLAQMAGGKSEDSRGMIIELLKASGSVLLQAVAETFNEILRENAQVPSYWKTNIIRVLYKKGDPQ